jgi:DNA-binding NtrC family response regulator
VEADKSTIVVVHPDVEEQRKIASALEPVHHPLVFARKTPDVLSVCDRQEVGVVIAPDVHSSADRAHVVERVQRESLRIPTVVLRERSSNPLEISPTRLLTGPVHYVIWPEEAADLAPVVRGLLRASSLLSPGAVPPGSENWIPALRNEGVERERRDLITALRACEGNLSRAAVLLGISRGGLQYRLRKHRMHHGSTVSRRQPRRSRTAQ